MLLTIWKVVDIRNVGRDDDGRMEWFTFDSEWNQEMKRIKIEKSSINEER